MSTQNRQPAGVPTGGQFAASAHAESEVALTDEPMSLDAQFDRDTFFPAAPLTPRDVEHLIEWRGRLEDGYDSDTVNRVLGGFESARLVCVWDYYDDLGYGGSSDFAGMARGGDPRSVLGDGRGSWRSIHPDVRDFLFEPDSDVDPESIPSLLSDEVFDSYDDVDGLNGDGFHNLAVEHQIED